ncbi:hypothetical protein KKC44_06400 [Patescibacteria group bacterium]|nr:hypothetical protein [Patescibacteria group bacterium]MBU2260200.1 hypothetical protein [Patescibacteria group bacterium]
MIAMHPEWHETEQDECNVPVRCANEKPKGASVLASGIPVSRKPAAILGILIVSSLAITYYQGSSRITGQVSSSPQLISITEDGTEPASVTVQQGQTITWINEHTIPHILESADLCNASGECLYTPTIFPGELVDFRITSDIPTGTYTYSSVTAENINGEIVVIEGDEVLPPEDPIENSDDPTEPMPPPPPETIEPPSDSDTDNSESITPVSFTPPPPNSLPIPLPTQNIPTNPNTVTNRSLGANLTDAPLHSGAPPPINTTHKPFRQPETGASSWIVFAISIIGLTWITRRAFYVRSS